MVDLYINDPIWTCKFIDDVGIQELVFSPNGRLLASAGGEKQVCLWSAVTGKFVQSLIFNDKRIITSLAFTPDGLFLFAGTNYGDVIAWGLVLPMLRADKLVRFSRCVRVTPDGRHVLVLSDEDSGDTITKVDAITLHVEGKITPHRESYGHLNQFIFSPSGKRILAASGERFSNFVLDIDTFQTCGDLSTDGVDEHETDKDDDSDGDDDNNEFSDTNMSAAVSCPANAVAIATASGKIQIYDANILDSAEFFYVQTDAEKFCTIPQSGDNRKGYGLPARLMSFSPSGDRLITASGEKSKATLWDVASAELFQNIISKGKVTSFAFCRIATV